MDANSDWWLGTIPSANVQWESMASYCHTDMTNELIDHLIEVSSQISYMVYQITEMSKIIWDLRCKNVELKIKLNEPSLPSNSEQIARIDNRISENNCPVQYINSESSNVELCDGTQQSKIIDLKAVSLKIKKYELKNNYKSCSLVLMLDFKSNNDYAEIRFRKRLWINSEWMKPIFYQRRKMHIKPMIYGYLRFVPRKCKKQNSKKRQNQNESCGTKKDINKNVSPSEPDGGQDGRLLG